MQWYQPLPQYQPFVPQPAYYTYTYSPSPAVLEAMIEAAVKKAVAEALAERDG